MGTGGARDELKISACWIKCPIRPSLIDPSPGDTYFGMSGIGHMLKLLRIVILATAASLFGAAQAACACAPYQAASASQADAAIHGGTQGSHGRAVEGHAGHGQTVKSQAPSSHDCGEGGDHCGFHAAHDLAAKANTAAKLAAPAPLFLLAVLSSPPAMPDARRSSEIRSSNVGWLPPPERSPVSLKVRLRN